MQAHVSLRAPSTFGISHDRAALVFFKLFYPFHFLFDKMPERADAFMAGTPQCKTSRTVQRGIWISENRGSFSRTITVIL